MTRSLASLRANPPKSRPERSLRVSLAGHLVAEVQALTEQLDRIESDPQPEPVDTEGRTGRPKRVGEGQSPESLEIRARLKAVLEEMEANEGDLLLAGFGEDPDGEWRRWANAHPAREEGTAGHKRDLEVAGGYCNADALIDDLGKYAAAWNGEPLAVDDWKNVIRPGIGGPDLKRIARSVVVMHEETAFDLPKWRVGLSADLRKWIASDSPETSESAPGDSTAGNPEPSNAGTTGLGTPAP